MVKILRTILKILGIAAAIILMVAALLYLTLYLAIFSYSPTKQEKQLIAAIQNHLKIDGDELLIKDILPGNWFYACINPTDVFSAMETEAITVKNVKVRNKDIAQSSEVTWGLYFVYPDNEIEYYSIPNKEILASTARGWSDHGKNCVAHAHAKLTVEDIQQETIRVKLTGD